MSETLWVTRGELVELSGFRLPLASVPVEARARLSPAALEARLVVPGLSYEQIRTLERQGMFDLFYPVATPERVKVLWRRPQRRRGETAQYSLLDVGTARLYAWMRRDGVSHAVIRKTLRGSGVVRALLMFAVTHVPDGVLNLSAGFGAICSESELRESVRAYPTIARQVFPIRWLGLHSQVLPRIRKMREVEPEVWRHGRYRSEPAMAAADLRV